MKNYKNIIPFIMVALMLASFVSLITNTIGENREYQEKLTEARKLAKLDVLEDSFQNYSDALKIKNTVEVNLEIGEMYVSHDWYSEAIAWGKHIIETFPKESKGYAFLLECYIHEGQFEEAFELRTQAETNRTVNEQFKKEMSKIEYAYDMGWNYFDDVGEEGNGFYPVRVGELWGYCNTEGEQKINPQFLEAKPFSLDGEAAVVDENHQYYYIAKSGNKKIALQNLKNVMSLSLTSNDMLVAGDNGVFGYYDRDFNKVLDGEYQYATIFNGGYAVVQTNSGWSLIDSKGKVVNDQNYDGFILDQKGIATRNDRAFARKGDSYIMINMKGEQIGEDSYINCRLFSEQDGYAAVQTTSGWTFIDKDGTRVIDSTFEDARSFKNGLAAVKKDGNWGYINPSGKLVIKNTFADAKDFNDKGKAFVKTDTAWVMIELYRNNN